MSTSLAHGGERELISPSLQWDLLRKAFLQLDRDFRSILVVPPDITRLHSGAGQLVKLIHSYWLSKQKSGDRFDILPAIGTHSPMTSRQREKMFGKLEGVNFLRHNWRADLLHLGDVPSSLLSELSGGKINENLPIAINRQIIEGNYDLIISIGQVVPHEVVGIANGFKNILIGAGGERTINISHFLGAIEGLERVMGKIDTSVRKILNYAHESFLRHLGIIYLMTVMERMPTGENVMRGLYMGDDRESFEMAAQLSQKLNINHLDRPLDRVVVYLPPEEFSSAWLGNKAIYRTRMAIADGGELLIIAPGVDRFGEDLEVDRLIRKFGYFGTEKTLRQVSESFELRNNLSAAAHLMHGTSEGRFKVVYATGGLTKNEVESVGYQWADISDFASKFNLKKLKNGFNDDFYYINNPSQGLWKFSK